MLVSSIVHRRNTFRVYHRIVQIKSNLFEIESLFETRSAFTSFDCLVTYYPHHYSSVFSYSVQLLCYSFKIPRESVISTEIIIGGWCNCDVDRVRFKCLEDFEAISLYKGIEHISVFLCTKYWAILQQLLLRIVLTLVLPYILWCHRAMLFLSFRF